MPEDTEAPGSPYRAHKFRLTWDGTCVAGLSKVSALRRTPPTITLERGVTYDPGFAHWINAMAVSRHAGLNAGPGETGGGVAASIAVPKDFGLEVYDETGRMVLAYQLYRCRPLEIATLPHADARGDTVILSMLRLEYEGCEQDARVRT